MSRRARKVILSRAVSSRCPHFSVCILETAEREDERLVSGEQEKQVLTLSMDLFTKQHKVKK